MSKIAVWHRDVRMKRATIRMAVAVVGLLALGACNGKTPEEKVAASSKSLGPEGEFTGTHLIIRWPALPSGKPEHGSVTLRIPREYLDDRPVAKDGKGGLFKVYVDFALPGVTPWDPKPHALRGDPPEIMKASREHSSSRVFVVLERDSSDGLLGRESTRREARTREFVRDGEVGGLERYTRKFCNVPDPRFPADAENWRKFLSEKEADDPTPAGCRLHRKEALLVSPPSVIGDDEGVSISCVPTGCNAYFRAAGRGAHINLKHDQLPHWQERVEPARKLLNSFVVPDAVSQPAASISQPAKR